MTMPTLKEQRLDLITEVRNVAEKAKTEARDLTADEHEFIIAKGAEVTELDKRITTAEKSSGILETLGKSAEEGRERGGVAARSPGEPAVTSVADAVAP